MNPVIGILSIYAALFIVIFWHDSRRRRAFREASRRRRERLAADHERMTCFRLESEPMEFRRFVTLSTPGAVIKVEQMNLTPEEERDLTISKRL